MSDTNNTQKEREGSPKIFYTQKERETNQIFYLVSVVNNNHSKLSRKTPKFSR